MEVGATFPLPDLRLDGMDALYLPALPNRYHLSHLADGETEAQTLKGLA